MELNTDWLECKTVVYFATNYLFLQHAKSVTVCGCPLHSLRMFSHFHVNCRYTMAHIWACPPSEGDDYIFHCHPAEQKIPKPKRLQEWYKKMLDKGIIERIVLDYKV